MAAPTTHQRYHIVVHRPDKVPVPSLPSTQLMDGDTSKITLKLIRHVCRVPTKFAFTSDGESAIADNTTLDYYVQLTPDSLQEQTQTNKAAADENVPEKADSKPQQAITKIVIKCVSTSPIEAPEKEHLAQSSLQSDLKSLFESRGNPVEGMKMDKWSKIEKNFGALKEKWAAKMSDTIYTEPGDLTEQQWESILVNNRILHGYHFDRDRGFFKAPKRAFNIRRPYEAIGPNEAEIGKIAYKNEAPGTNPTSRNSSGNKVATLGDANEPAVTKKDGKDDIAPLVHESQNTIPGKPRFYIDDDSRVNITEIKSETQRKFAKQGFNSEAWEVNAALKVASLSAKKDDEHSYDELKVNTQDTAELFVTYSFPRVVLELEPETLQLSDDCLEDIRNIQTEKDVAKFYANYGTILPTRLLLGGCLQSTRSLNSKGDTEIKSRKDETRWAAGLTFSSPSFSAGANYANVKSTTNKEGTQIFTGTAFLTWEARGGDTVLCSDPPSWAYTVKDYRLWRVMEQSKLTTLYNMIETIHYVAAYRLSNPQTATDLDKGLDRTPVQRIMSRMTAIIMASETDVVLGRIKAQWKSEQHDPTRFNAWLDEIKAPHNKVQAGLEWAKLSITQRTYYGIFLQLKRGLPLILR